MSRTKYRPLHMDGTYEPLPEEPPLWLTCLSWAGGLMGGFLMVVVLPVIITLLLIMAGVVP